MATSDLTKFLLENNIGNSTIIETVGKMDRDDIDYPEFMRLYESLMIQVCGKIDVFTLGGEKRMQQGSLADPQNARRGFHVFRTWAANLAHQKRVKRFSNDKEMADIFMKDGIVAIEDMFPTFDEVEEYLAGEFKQFPSFVHKRPHNLCTSNAQKAPVLNSIFESVINHPSLQNVLGARLGSPIRGFFDSAKKSNTFYQRVRNSPDDNDNQKNLHIDTFFPALKFWWFSQDVKAEQGAFVYVRGSTNQTVEYFQWLYEQSIKICEKTYDEWRLIDHSEGSLRVSESELKLMGLEAKPVEVKKNTLVVGNVGGFHGRGNTTETFTRNSIHGSVRLSNPFLV